MERMDQNQRQRACFVQFALWRHRGRSLRLRLHPVRACFDRRLLSYTPLTVRAVFFLGGGKSKAYSLFGTILTNLLHQIEYNRFYRLMRSV